MLDSLIYSVNTVFPIFIIVALGYLLMRTGFINTAFTATAEKLVFKVALPVMLFLEVSGADPQNVFDGRFILFCTVGIFVTFLLLCVTVPLFVRDNAKRGAFIQGVYRSNFAILGVPLAQNMFGQAGVEQIAMIMPFAITFFNVFAVIILSIYAPSDVRQKPAALIKRIILDLIKNPLIIGVLSAVPLLIFQIELPVIANKSLTYLSNMVMPVSLICIGGNFSFDSLKGRIRLAVTASLFRTVVVPITAVLFAAAMGFTGPKLGVILILFGAPTAVSSFIMAKNMKSDHELAGQIILLSTLLCIATVFSGVFVLKTLSLI